MLAYNSTTNIFNVYENSGWTARNQFDSILPQTSGGAFQLTNTAGTAGLFLTNAGSVGLSYATTPLFPLHIKHATPYLTLTDTTAPSIDGTEQGIKFNYGSEQEVGFLGYLTRRWRYDDSELR